MAVREGFEPSKRCRLHTFQACAFDHSATSPYFTLSFFVIPYEPQLGARLTPGILPYALRADLKIVQIDPYDLVNHSATLSMGAKC